MTEPGASPDAYRSGMRVSIMSVAWTVSTSSAAIAAGITSRALVLIVFGLTGLLDAAGSITLALHFRHVLRHEAVSEGRERLALHVVSAGLIGIAVFTTIESTRRLVGHARVHPTPFGLAVAGASIVALTALTMRKRVVAARVRSRALKADSWLSATGAALGAVALAGAALASRPHLAWIDPVTALIVGCAAGAVGVGALRKEEGDLLPPP